MLVNGGIMKIGVDTSGYKALRRHRLSLPYQIYLITFTTDKRQPVFDANAIAARLFVLRSIIQDCGRKPS
jgi:hypothetical protein